VDDLADLLPGEGVEDDDVVHPVQELGVEGPLDLLAHLVLHDVVAGLGIGGMEPEAPALGDVPGPQVGGHDEDGVLEVDDPPVVVRQVPLVQDLQEEVEDVGVGLLDLVQEDHGVGAAPHRLGEGARVLVAHVTGRRPDEAETRRTSPCTRSCPPG
jgi:hypothetical protein